MALDISGKQVILSREKEVWMMYRAGFSMASSSPG
jgi:hypothetical protein